uniref:Uncharacterized protein n=1 Tax=Anopheles dirus TaxID=7168 RepID=A0A182NT60_9DIPT
MSSNIAISFFSGGRFRFSNSGGNSGGKTTVVAASPTTINSTYNTTTRSSSSSISSNPPLRTERVSKDHNGNAILQQPAVPLVGPSATVASTTCCAAAATTLHRAKFMSTTRCDGYVGSRIASRYDEDEEDDDGGGGGGGGVGGDDVDPDGTIPEEDEEEDEEEQTVQCSRGSGGSVSQSRTHANRYRRAFGARW